MRQPAARIHWLVLLLRIIGAVCLLALFPLWMPRAWIGAGHRSLGLGTFPNSPIAEYLARSVSALSGFYGGLLNLPLDLLESLYGPSNRGGKIPTSGLH